MRLIDLDEFLRQNCVDRMDGKTCDECKHHVLEVSCERLMEQPTAEVTLCHLDSPCEYQNADIAMPSAQQWIPVTERLPIPNSVDEDVFVYYLVQNEYGDMTVATFVQFPGGARVWQQMYQYGAIMEDIVAWMPLPEPYRKVE